MLYIVGKITGDWIEKMSLNDFASWIIEGVIQSNNCNPLEGCDEWDELLICKQIDQIQQELLSFLEETEGSLYLSAK